MIADAQLKTNLFPATVPQLTKWRTEAVLDEDLGKANSIANAERLLLVLDKGKCQLPMPDFAVMGQMWGDVVLEWVYDPDPSYHPSFANIKRHWINLVYFEKKAFLVAGTGDFSFSGSHGKDLAGLELIEIKKMSFPSPWVTKSHLAHFIFNHTGGIGIGKISKKKTLNKKQTPPIPVGNEIRAF